MRITQTAGAKKAADIRNMYSKLLDMSEDELKVLAEVVGIPYSIIWARLSTEEARRARELRLSNYLP
jgi:hypothetical protein